MKVIVDGLGAGFQRLHLLDHAAGVFAVILADDGDRQML